MSPKHDHSRAGALVLLGLVCAVPACARDREPTGPTDVGGAHSARLGGFVYAEERRAVELSKVVPDLAGFFLDTVGNLVVAIKHGEASEARRHGLRPRFARELLRARRRNPSADFLVRPAQYSFVELKTWRDRLMSGDILEQPGVVWLDLDEVKNRVVIGLDGGDPGGLRAASVSLGVPA